MAVAMQYGQQDAYAQQAPLYGGGMYSPGGTYAPQQAQYVDPAYATPQQPQPAMYGPQQQYGPPQQQAYATDPYGQPVMAVPSSAAVSPMSYDPGYVNYMYGMQTPRSTRRQVIQSPSGRKGVFSTDSILTVLIVCGTLFLVLLAMLLIVTVVVPRLTRKSRSGHKKIHELALEHENVADAELPLDAPQMSGGSKAEQTASKLNSSGAKHGAKHGPKDPEMARHVKSRTKG
ncbi:uncharacterized protein LOC119431097 [Dermacentor silvarum]|uniref:uncharacterized protein LOC119431097 n=1 Tax=Dermacentor silvarum TaxID=543639 RepID=UPI002101792D|nr:uncharacterized protein LOC119431097 [Dermacentor silvarum]